MLARASERPTARDRVAESAVTLEERGSCLVTCRMSWVRESVLKAMDRMILTRTTEGDELEFFRARLAAASLDPELANPLSRTAPRTGGR